MKSKKSLGDDNWWEHKVTQAVTELQAAGFGWVEGSVSAHVNDREFVRMGKNHVEVGFLEDRMNSLIQIAPSGGLFDWHSAPTWQDLMGATKDLKGDFLADVHFVIHNFSELNDLCSPNR
jgi:hypothetical protein